MTVDKLLVYRLTGRFWLQLLVASPEGSTLAIIGKRGVDEGRGNHLHSTSSSSSSSSSTTPLCL
ncbi:hypothetical protein E2C01_042074 [Portunus trituberculatus]|uniref:Uncharacterized protein n=1 Tax=Portunus trituberculatus TaxID=210409 RepID=A0A5B7FS20_PORTR|nr:hypothetical protein [Portunus trituberculatus]